MLKDVWSQIPGIFKFLIVVIFILSIGLFSYSVSKCGLGKTLLLGNGAFVAAVSGMCD